MNKLPLQKRVQILSMLCEGVSMRSISRVADVSINTVSKLLVDAGLACVAYHDEKVRGLTCRRIQCDEIWAFCYTKQKNVEKAKRAPDRAGDAWTWTSIDADTKLICNWLVGRRDAEFANEFMDDLAQRLTHRVQLTTDGHGVYLDAVEGAFSNKIDYAQLVKTYGAPPDAEKRYSPAECTGCRRTPKIGNPEWRQISTSFVERSNLQMRMGMRRFTRLTNAHSKKFANHCHALALYFFYYNWIRQHASLRVSPAMASGRTNKLLNWEDLIDLIDSTQDADSTTARG